MKRVFKPAFEPKTLFIAGSPDKLSGQVMRQLTKK